MRRRRYLTLLPASLAGAAGCLGDVTDAGGGPGETDDPTGTADPTDTTGDPGGTTTAPDGTTGSPPETPAFPPDDDGVDRVVWADDVEDVAGNVVFDATLASTDLPDASATFSLRNRTDRTFATNFYDWRLYRREGGRWHRVAPLVVNLPLMQVPPGEGHEWAFSASSSIPAEIPRTGGTEEASVRPVGGGTYAFVISGWFPDQEATPTHEHETVFAARFDLDGPTLSLEPSDAVTAVERDGGVVSVTADGRTSEESRRATYVLSRAPDADGGHPIVTEQAYRRWPLRDALAHAEDGVDEVRLRAPTGTHPPFGVQTEESPAVSYDGTTWRVSVEGLNDE